LAVAEASDTPDLHQLRERAATFDGGDDRTVLISTRPRGGSAFAELNAFMTGSDVAINVETFVASDDELSEYFQID
jgi:hypothetical protein